MARGPSDISTELRTVADRTRLDTRNPGGYFAMMRDFILNGRIGDQPYGSSTIYRPKK
jgi:hypothetical protein